MVKTTWAKMIRPLGLSFIDARVPVRLNRAMASHTSSAPATAQILENDRRFADNLSERKNQTVIDPYNPSVISQRPETLNAGKLTAENLEGFFREVIVSIDILPAPRHSVAMK